MSWKKAISHIESSPEDAKIYVGCDSVRSRNKKTRKWIASYFPVIIIHHPDSCRVFRNKEVLDDFGNIRQRMLNEVNFATQAALAIIDIIEDRPLEIHLDINTDPKHKSSSAASEASGWVQGMFGFKPKLKPDAWAASHTSDHYARGKEKV